MVVRVLQSATFERWLNRLRDRRAAARIKLRLSALSDGNFGDVKSIGAGVFEMRTHYGPGYRLYFIREGEEVVVLLCGGDKSTQRQDIERAQRMAKERRQA